MNLNLSVDQVLTTTRSVRKRLDVTRPVPRALIEECLDLALQAPNGGNENTTRWLVVDDPDMIAKLAAIYIKAVNEHTGGTGEYKNRPPDIPGYERMIESSFAMLEKLPRMPAIVLPLMRYRPENRDSFVQSSMWGSVIPALWSFFLALRARGLGSAWTTVSLKHEKEIAELFDIPMKKYTQVGLFPVAYTIGTEFKRAYRKPVSDVLYYNRFEQNP